MRRSFLLAALIAATPAAAAEPTTLSFPMPLINDIANYLRTRPYDEVAGMIGQLRQCILVQVPDPRGVVVSQAGQCDPVREAIESQHSMPTPRGAAAQPSPSETPSTPTVKEMTPVVPPPPPPPPPPAAPKKSPG